MRISRIPPHLRKPVLAAGVLALLVGGAVFLFRGWDRQVEDRLGRWAAEQVARRTDGAYRLTLGDVAFLPLAGSISFDSLVVRTDSVRNARRGSPLPRLEWRGGDCRVTGLDVPGLLLRKSFNAAELGCARVLVSLTLTGPDGKGAGAADSAGAPVAPEDVGRTLGLRSVRVGEISFPAFGLRLVRPGERGGSSIALDSARLEVNDLHFDPAASPGSGKALSADRARLTATGVLFRPDTLIELAVARLEAGFTDSTLGMAGVRHEPTIPEREWLRRVRVRRDRIAFELDTLEARGFAWRGFVGAGEVGMRVLELGGLRFDVLSDRRIPRGRPRRHRTPQQVAAGRGPSLRVDTLRVAGGSIAYRERRPGAARPGRVVFEALRATMTDLEMPARGTPLRVAARAKVMGEGELQAEATVPLDAPDFRYDLSGRLGPMRAAAFNRFLSENESFEFDEGMIDAVEFRQTVRDGLARTTLTPRYRDLSVEPTGEGGGIVASVKRTVTRFIANALVVRSRNPADDGDDLRIARTARVYDPANTWIQFLWLSMRDALTEGLQEHPDEDDDADGRKDRERRSPKP